MMQQPGSAQIVAGESRTVLTAGETAASVARLIVAALSLERIRSVSAWP